MSLLKPKRFGRRDTLPYNRELILKSFQEDPIIKLFKEGNSVNHIVFLLKYKISIDVVTLTIQRYIDFLEEYYVKSN